MNLSTKHMTPGLLLDTSRERESAAWVTRTVVVIMTIYFEDGVQSWYTSCRRGYYYHIVSKIMFKSLLEVKNMYMTGIEFQAWSVDDSYSLHIMRTHEKFCTKHAFECDFSDVLARYS